MKRIRHILQVALFFVLPVLAGSLRAADEAVTNAAAAAVASGQVNTDSPSADFLEHMVDVVLALFDVKSSGNTTIHYVIAALFLVGSYLLRRAVTRLLFGVLKKFSARTQTTLDDKLFPALEGPVAALITITGFFAALRVLKLTPEADMAVGYGSTVAFSLAIFWGLLRAFGSVLDHVHEIATAKQMGIATFMPWIKKTLMAVFVVLGVLMVVQSLGYNVKTILGAAGIGGLAFALAAQDTIANLFGSLVVATDQPFKIGEVVRIGSEVGTVEDIGLRSTKIRKVDRSLMIIPNKSVAGENITNLSRFNGRRVEQVLGLTYQTSVEKMDDLVSAIRQMLQSETQIDPASVIVYFRDFSASSLDIWIVYVVKDPDFQKHMALRQRLNFDFMKAVEARGLSFAYPTQTVFIEGQAVAKPAGS